MYSDQGIGHSRNALAINLHWIEVFVAVQLICLFVTSGRIADADIGLTNGLVLALGMFNAGAPGNWRLLVVGAALAAATTDVAFIEENLWVILGVAVVAVPLLVFGGRLSHSFRSGTGASA